MSEHIIKATGRNVEGKGASRRLRRAASIPAIIYGGKNPPQAIQLDHEKIWLASQHEWFYSSILSLELDGKAQDVLLRDMQRHPFKQIIMHLDFQRVDANQAIRVAVPLHFLNEDKSPAGKAADVVVTHELNEVEVSCLPKDLPEFIEIDLSALTVGDIVHLSELKLPKGVEIPELKLGKEHDVAVVIAKHGKEEVEEATDAPEADVPAAKVAKKDEDKK
ncbi:50S ribosomal protein L25/general stress protein Ctc [Lysobacter capsici]|jgi:large subunit ribosomal protein L25|uniref:Large ribosomal subunit protein bL25 n=1 Tax=Lysobacter capsici AZ78 TaxID=1444315 RepID=A0A108UD88_9GAMM|nr:50S ribosomal protein L25/general stress protein Ctc [Lysobacter capsici]ATE73042.1 50S ribosomal protein L25 [Lysobacter capsici]KWS06987.1 LSU ribosomal protein L25p [Lysobacter capsici AZ78]QWF15793.1 50S ribosomal protein L25/general stress protein Ctc [Lysobacter capsici]UOF13676.1 50S ribosomal protein L25/general stress protein Ctc [Lysobacter capsici]WND79207.1 50S ribosomal protein L25/general stress protein Ctc [Lysobacter capsici]